MRWIRVFLSAIAVTAFGTVYSMVTCGWLFKWVYLIPPTEVWRLETEFTSLFWVILIVGSLILSLFLAAVFGWIFTGLPGRCRLCRGSAYGLMVWLVGVLPGMFGMYMFTMIAPTVIIYWTIANLIHLQISGLIISGIYGHRSES